MVINVQKATIAMKEQRKLGLLNDLEVSDEINACSIYIDVDVDGVNEPWLLMFKNETHNHPTEIEPFGGASTCIGGAIRDPLSGRSYVYQAMRISGGANILESVEETMEGKLYQAMRISGGANILESVEETMEGKLPQKIISKRSADGNSSYGNQIGLPTSFVREIYHDGYKAKHMEVGAVVGAVKASDVRREKPIPGDIIILLGGQTGRDGVGGATGSSKAHTEDSIQTASSEVQKGNAPTERKIQRLFRNGEVTRLIKKCNDLIISKRSADGNSSYGNQIGLPTSFVREIYHDGYKAKHMEVGAVVGAVKASDVRREKPIPGDIIILLGGQTGRDGVGGATGSSKAHTEDSIQTASSEVQKGNAPTERKIQRLFRNGEVTRLIKKCNDFGAGGVAVAIGELADGLDINLDAVPVKYNGLNGTELAISESQERMAVLVAKEDVETFIKHAQHENLEATVVAEVTDTNRLVMNWNGRQIVNLSRTFLDTNGARQTTDVLVSSDLKGNPFVSNVEGKNIKEKFLNNLKQPNVASQQGMVEMFDSTIGATTVLMPYGGKYQLTETEGSVHKIPLRHGKKY